MEGLNLMENEFPSHREMRLLMKKLRKDYNDALIEISDIYKDINEKDDLINETIEMLEASNQIASPLISMRSSNSHENEDKPKQINLNTIEQEPKAKSNTFKDFKNEKKNNSKLHNNTAVSITDTNTEVIKPSSNQFNHRISGGTKLTAELKSELNHLKRNHEVQMRYLNKNHEERIEAQIRLLESDYNSSMIRLQEENDKTTKELQCQILKMKEDLADFDGKLMSAASHEKIIGQLYHEKNLEVQQYIDFITTLSHKVYNIESMEVSKVSSILSLITNFLGKYNSHTGTEVKLNTEPSAKKINVLSLKSEKTGNQLCLTNRYSSHSKNKREEEDYYSDQEPEEEDDYSVSDEFDVDDNVDEIRINKINCLKIDSEFFEKKNKFTSSK